MTERLRVGDTVVCQAPDAHFLERHRVYRITESWDQGELVQLDAWKGHLWGSWRFLRVDENNVIEFPCRASTPKPTSSAP